MKKYKANMAVIIDANIEDAREICERIEAEFIDNIREHPDFRDLEENEDYEVFTLEEFMHGINEDEFNLTRHFVAFFNNI
jgi:hypothetical protein